MVYIEVVFKLLGGLLGSRCYGTTGLSLEEQIYAELVIVQRSSSIYLTLK